MAFLQYGRARLGHEQGGKPTAIDEWWDTYVNRPLAGVLVRGVANTAVTPNQLTVLSATCGVGAAWCVSRGQGNWLVLGGVLLMACMIFDCADGQLARLRGGGSFIGRMMDGYADWLTATSLHFGLWGFFFANGFNLLGREFTGAFSTFLPALAAGASMALHSMLYDFYKNRYLGLTGDGENDTHTPEEVRERLDAAGSLGERAYLWFYWLYCKTQSSVAKDERGDGQPVDPRLARIRRHYLGREMRLLGPVGPTLHLVAFAVSAVLAGYFGWGIYVYFTFSVVFANVYLAAVTFAIRRLEARMEAEIAALG